MSGEAGLRPILKLLQISGLAPYVVGKDRRHSRVSFGLVAYNLLLAFAVIYNTIYAETDCDNNVDFANKSFLIGIAFDVVDVLENIHICFASLRSLLHTKVGTGVWLKMKHLNRKLSDLNVEFDDTKFRRYIYIKSGIFCGLSVIFLTVDIYLCTRLGMYYTANYWMVCAIPLFFNSAVSATFSGMLLILYQRFWVINEFLKRYAEHGLEEGNESKWRNGNSLVGDQSIENIFLFSKTSKKLFVKRVPKKVPVRPVQKPLQKKTPPSIVMLKNYEECFAKEYFREGNTVRVIRSLKIIHFGLFEVANDLNTIFGWNLLFIFTASFFGCTINMYFVIIFHLRSYDVEQYVSSLSWTSVYLFKVFYLIAYTTKVTQEACKTIDLLHVLLNQTDLNDIQLQAELKAFCLQISQCKVEFKAAEFFTVDRAILFQFVAGVLSNVIFVVQFDKINFSGR